MDTVVMRLSVESLARLQSHAHQVWTDIRELGKFWDATLKSEDGGSFLVHKVIMMLCSPYFRALFTSKINKKPRYKFIIPGVSGNMLRLIVNYAYSGVTKVNEDNIISLMPAADQFNVTGMVIDCTEFLLERMGCENCMGFKEFASCFFIFELEIATKKFMSTNFLELVEKSEEFLEMGLPEVESLLNSDRINVRNEEQVWEAGLKWVMYKPHERKKHIHSIMRCVRLGLLDTSYFHDKVKQHPFVEENHEYCRPIVMKTLTFLWDLDIIAQREDIVETPFLAIPRIPYSVLFTIGGWTAGAPTNLIETYDTKADRWIQIKEVDPTGPRAYHKLTIIGFDIYVIGGFDGNIYFNTCRCFNAVTKKWRCVAPMHAKRCYVSVASLDDLIYAMGGFDGLERHNSVERYDHHRNQEQYISSRWTLISPMNAQRSDASATTLNKRVYIVGGFNGNECLYSGEYYNPETNQWTIIARMTHRRSGVSIIGYHGHIYALGGFNGISRLVHGDKYDPETDEWRPIPDMFNPRSNFAIEVMDDMIFVMGGFNGVTTIFHVECYDHRTNEWYEATDMNVQRSALSACVIPGLPNVDDYIHKNRSGLMEEKRQKILQQRAIMATRQLYMKQLEEMEEEEDANITT